MLPIICFLQLPPELQRWDPLSRAPEALPDWLSGASTAAFLGFQAPSTAHSNCQGLCLEAPVILCAHLHTAWAQNTSQACNGLGLRLSSHQTPTF